ncbi:MAG: regulator of sigma protease [Candidatus Cloacimonadota bacterium]|nr:regulator of sigma protease [Candidatus Cloacimonadota bacterium]
MISFLLMILALGVMITIHETGHFLVARAFGVGIEKFSIGFGAPIAQFERGGIKYRISWIPLGGYVKMKGEDLAMQGEDDTPPQELFSNKAWWQRALIAFSGPFANLLLGLLLFIVALLLPQSFDDLPPVIHEAEGKWAAFFEPGDSLITVNEEAVSGFNAFLISLAHTDSARISYARAGEILQIQVAKAEKDSLMQSLKPVVSTKIGEVFSGMPAWRAGLKPGDIVLQVDSVAVNNWYDMRSRILDSPADEVKLLLKRDDEIFSREIKLEENIGFEQGRMIGIGQYMPLTETVVYNLPEAIRLGAYSSGNFIIMNYRGLFQLLKRPAQLKNSLGGPILMASMSTEMGRKGISTLVLFFGSISLILMVMNLLPIPILDGGHIMFCFIEGIFGRPLPLKIQAMLQRIGFALLITLMIFAFYADLSKLFYRFVYTR